MRLCDSISGRVGILALTPVLVAGSTQLSAQGRASQRQVANPGETQFKVDFLRPSGGAVPKDTSGEGTAPRPGVAGF
jgi:hypothetical protein